jgi:hypothetical protein
MRALLLLAALLIGLGSPARAGDDVAAGQTVIPAAEPGKCSLVWAGHESEIEQLLLDGKVAKLEDVPIGVTKPQRATLEGSPVRFAWKPLILNNNAQGDMFNGFSEPLLPCDCYDGEACER